MAKKKDPQREVNYRIFWKNIVPRMLEAGFNIQRYQDFLRVRAKTWVYDYYPKGERLRIQKPLDDFGVQNEWKDLPLVQVDRYFKIQERIEERGKLFK